MYMYIDWLAPVVARGACTLLYLLPRTDGIAMLAARVLALRMRGWGHIGAVGNAVGRDPVVATFDGSPG